MYCVFQLLQHTVVAEGLGWVCWYAIGGTAFTARGEKLVSHQERSSVHLTVFRVCHVH